MDRNVGIKLGRQLRALRQAAGMTQAELAAASLKSTETISNFERGKSIPSVLTLSELADRLGVSLAKFFMFEEEPKRHSKADALAAHLAVLTPPERSLTEEFIKLLVRQRPRRSGRL